MRSQFITRRQVTPRKTTHFKREVKLFADARCSETILAFLEETEVGLKRCGEVDWGGGSASSTGENRLEGEEQLRCSVYCVWYVRGAATY